MSHMRFRAAGVLPVAVTFAILAGSVGAGVIRVNAAAPSGGDGTSWATALNDLQAAITAAQPGDEIWIPANARHRLASELPNSPATSRIAASDRRAAPGTR